VTAAHFGLAAIAENRTPTDRSQWEIARQHYQGVLDSQAAPAFKNLASQRLGRCWRNLQQPVLTDVPPLFPGATSRPTTAPAAQPSAQPTTR